MYYDRVIVNNNSYILGATSKGLSFVGSMNKDVSEIYQFYPGVSLTSDKKVTDRYVQEISAYLRKQRYDFDLSIDISGTDFQNDVWKELLRIPYGKTRNYTQIAEQIDRKKP
jgi:Methylated DNA-protein cysteine methyltransferase